MFLHDLTIKKVRDAVLGKEISAFELTKKFLEFIEKKDRHIGAYLHLRHDEALEQANAVDIKIAKEEPLGSLGGVPMAVKDNILIRDSMTTAGSKILAHYRASYHATVIDKLSNSDAIFLGKTNLDEFAMGSSTENSAFQITKNPHDSERVPGGSSGGSAAAVAGSMAVSALGSDTGGSIRQPAAFCGVVGLKPTYGAVSRYGLIAMASSLDQIGPFAKTVEDAALVFDVIRGHDVNDATSVSVEYPDTLIRPELGAVKQLRVGIPDEYFGEGVDPLVADAANRAVISIKSLGVSMRRVSLPHTKYAAPCYYIIMPAEVSSNLARFDGMRYVRIPEVTKKAKSLSEIYLRQRGGGFGTEVKRRIVLGTFVLSSGYYDAYYARAQKARSLIKQDFDSAFEEVDVLLAPVTPTPAFKIGEKTDDPLSMYLSDIFTIPVNLAGLPAISIPVRDLGAGSRNESVLPVGFQLIGKHFREQDILGLGVYYDKLFGL